MDYFASFSHLTGPRVQGRCLHQLLDILYLLRCGTLAGCDELLEICNYGRARLDFLRSELSLAFANGIPSEDTLERLLKRLNPKELEHKLRACAGSLAGRQLCVDGKEHRASTPAGQRHALVRTLSVWVADAHLSFGQAQIGAKTNEKTAIPALLDTLDVTGSIVTIDAIAYQPGILGQVVTRGADYVIALKKNAKTLYEQASDHLLARAVSLPAWRSLDKGRGRGERRTVRICQDLTLLEACADWPGRRTLVLVETERHTSQGVTHTQRFYLSSLADPDPAVYARLVGGTGPWRTSCTGNSTSPSKKTSRAYERVMRRLTPISYAKPPSTCWPRTHKLLASNASANKPRTTMNISDGYCKMPDIWCESPTVPIPSSGAPYSCAPCGFWARFCPSPRRYTAVVVRTLAQQLHLPAEA